MKLSLYEQETIILYNQAEATAEVYTHDSRLLEKLRRLAEKYPDQIVKKDRQTFLVPKRCVSVREPYSAERRKAAHRGLDIGAGRGAGNVRLAVGKRSADDQAMRHRLGRDGGNGALERGRGDAG